MQQGTFIRLWALVVLVLVVTVGGSPARAQRAPDLATVDRGDGISRLGLDLGFSLVDGEPDASALRVELFGQYMTRSGLGVYGALPVSILFIDDASDEAALSNIDVGGLYVIYTEDVSWVLRGGLALPTADDDLGGVLANYLASWPRLTDFSLTIPDALYVRLAGSALIHTRSVFVRVDAGVDVPATEGDEYLAPTLFRGNVGVGIDLGAAALSAELATLASFDEFDAAFEDDPTADENFLHSAAITVRFMGESLQPFFGVGLPLDELGRDEVDLFFTGGLQVAF